MSADRFRSKGEGMTRGARLLLCSPTPNSTIGNGVDANENAFPCTAPPEPGYEHAGHNEVRGAGSA
jgi:hypothetical protein